MSQLVGRHQVGLVEDDAVGESDLRLGLGCIVEMKGNVFGIHQRHDAVEAEALLDFLIAEEGLSDRAGIGQAGRFHQHIVELIPALHELTENSDEVAAHSAAKATIVHLEDLFVGLDDQFVVDTDLTKLVLDNRNPLPVVGCQNAVQQGGLAGAEKAREDGHRNARVVVFGHSLPQPCWKVLPMANPAVAPLTSLPPTGSGSSSRTDPAGAHPQTRQSAAGPGRSEHWNVHRLTPSRLQRENSTHPHVPCERRTDPAGAHPQTHPPMLAFKK